MASFHTVSPIHTAPGGISVFNPFGAHFSAVCAAPGSIFEWLAADVEADGSPKRVN